MRPLPVLSELPGDYRVEEGPRAVLAVRASAREALERAGFGLEGDGVLRESDLAGRRPMFEIGSGGERFVLRRFAHGGLLRWLTRWRFADPERPFREIVLARALERAGVPTAEVVAARARRARGGGWRLDVVTRRVEGALDLGAVVELASRGGLEPAARLRIAAAAGAFVRSMHEAGFLHADLNPRNLLVGKDALAGGAPRLWVLDLDRSRLVPALGERERRDNLRRLFRHVARLEEEGRARLARTDLARFLAAYDRGSWRELWRSIAREHAATHRVHSAGWALERRLGRGPAAARARPGA